VSELDDVLAVVLVYALAELSPERQAIVTIDRGVVRDDVASAVDPAPRREDCADSAAREFELPVDPGLRARAVVVVEAARDIRPEDPVLDRQVPERERLKDRIG
jgi:hypothetical protein